MSNYIVTADEIDFFCKNGYLIVKKFFDFELINEASLSFDKIFSGFFETTIPPDEWRWATNRDPQDVTRMIWNGWKSNLSIARVSLNEKVGYYCATLAGWSGTRLNQDGCIWKPPGGTGLAFHRDIDYNKWFVPNDMVTCLVSLNGASQENGTLEYAIGSQNWVTSEIKPLDFHEPLDYKATIAEIAKFLDTKLEFISIDLSPGDVVFHNSLIWHGSGKNYSSKDRKALSLHCMPMTAEFHPTNFAFAQGRYRQLGYTVMRECDYPILWGENNCRSKFINDFLNCIPLTEKYRAHYFTREQ